jgi:hypothetical protein
MKLTDPDWHIYTFPSYGFQVDISTVLYPQHSLLINNGAGEQTDWIYQGAALGSSLRSASAETTVVVEYSTSVVDTNICPSSGTPMSIGSGIRAYETASVPPDSNGPAASQPYVRVNLVTGGVAIQRRPGRSQHVLRSVRSPLAAHAGIVWHLRPAPAARNAPMCLRYLTVRSLCCIGR